MSMVIQIKNAYKFWLWRIYIKFLPCNTSLNHPIWIIMSVPSVVEYVGVFFLSGKVVQHYCIWTVLWPLMLFKYHSHNNRNDVNFWTWRILKTEHSCSLKKSHVVKIVVSFGRWQSFELLISSSFNTIQSSKFWKIFVCYFNFKCYKYMILNSKILSTLFSPEWLLVSNNALTSMEVLASPWLKLDEDCGC